MLSRPEHQKLLRRRKFSEVVATAVRIESRTNVLFSFEKMALRDAVKSPTGARAFASGLHDFLSVHLAPLVGHLSEPAGIC